MPCRSDYMEASGREKEGRLVATLLNYVLECEGEVVPAWILGGVADYYGQPVTGRLDEATNMLCEKLGNMCPDEQDAIIYNGRNAMARKLADWWEKHQAFDRKRKEIEAKASEKVKELKKIADILSTFQRELIGMDEDGNIKNRKA